jgi:hypothetical protein
MTVLVRLGNFLLIVALLAATGGHWVLLQSVAWTNMFAANLQRENSLGVSLVKTLDGHHPCSLCKNIDAGKNSESKSNLPLEIKKIEFVSQRATYLFSAPSHFDLLPHLMIRFSSLSEQPPIQPPRSLPA